MNIIYDSDNNVSCMIEQSHLTMWQLHY